MSTKSKRLPVGRTEHFALAKDERREFGASISSVHLQSGYVIVAPLNNGDPAPELLTEDGSSTDFERPIAPIVLLAKEPSHVLIDFTDKVI